MSDELLRKLRDLEEDYFEMPAVVRRSDLKEINQLRADLGLPQVDDRLKELGEVAADEPALAESVEAAPVEDHSEARAIYEAWQRKNEELKVLREYADRVASATAGGGQTPVRPLATMGQNGPLLCDHCGKPMILEGGRFNGMFADDAWKQKPRGDWQSFILGGMVVEIQTNGTLRIYHGYPSRNSNDCCNAAAAEDEKARAEFDLSIRIEKLPILTAFIASEFPDLSETEQTSLLNEIVGTMYSYDPGPGINRPSE